MILKSFGCSFIWGSELPDEIPGRRPSSLVWPSLLAQQLGLNYGCHAWPGRGNLFIAHTVMNQALNGDFVVVNWTYIDRFDYNHCSDDSWRTCLPGDQDNAASFYYREIHSQYNDKLRSLMYIDHTISFLEQNQIPYIMTAQDSLLFETEWHTSPGIEYLQARIRPKLYDFNGKNFVQWATAQGHAITNQGHLLQSGHRAVADHVIQMRQIQ